MLQTLPVTRPSIPMSFVAWLVGVVAGIFLSLSSFLDFFLRARPARLLMRFASSWSVSSLSFSMEVSLGVPDVPVLVVSARLAKGTMLVPTGLP